MDRRYRREIEEILARMERERPSPGGQAGRGNPGSAGRGSLGDPFGWLRALAWRLTPGSTLLTALLLGAVAAAVIANLLRPTAPLLGGYLGLAAALAFGVYYWLSFRRRGLGVGRREVRWRWRTFTARFRRRW